MGDYAALRLVIVDHHTVDEIFGNDASIYKRRDYQLVYPSWNIINFAMGIQAFHTFALLAHALPVGVTFSEEIPKR